MKEFKLPKKVKNKWVKALRSGLYKQGILKLKDEEKIVLGRTRPARYCCLGVAYECGLAKTEHGRSVLGESFLNENFAPIKLQKELAIRNDSGEWSFKRIATWIEKNL